MAALLLVVTTPLTGWTAALESWRAPRILILVIQFVYRYLFVIAEQAQRMRWAALCRGRGSFGLAAGLVGVLFARSWQRADGIYHAMLARGFRGRFVPAAPTPFRAVDALFFSACLAGCLAVRILL